MMADQPTASQEILTVDQVAEEFQLTAQTIRNWIKAGTLPAVKVGKVYRVKREDIDALLSREQSESGPLGTHRDPWAPETLGVPYRRRDDGRPASVWDGTSSPISAPKRP
jgi:excisionase family DNA binding protein